MRLCEHCSRGVVPVFDQYGNEIGTETCSVCCGTSYVPDSQIHEPAPHPLDDTDEPDARRRETAAEAEEREQQREAME